MALAPINLGAITGTGTTGGTTVESPTALASNAMSAAQSALDEKYVLANAWASYGAELLQTRLGNITSASEKFDITEFVEAAKAAIEGIPDITSGTITYTAPPDPTYDIVPSYVSPVDVVFDAVTYTPPTVPTYDTVVYNAPAEPVLDDVTYNAPTPGALLDIGTPTVYSAGTAPSTTITFDNPDFSDTLLGELRSKLSSDLASGSTGLGSAESGLFGQAVARESDVLAEAYRQVTTQFSARGFDMPPGALNALVAQESNKSTIRLTDVNTAIMSESAKLAQAWNQTAVTASAQLVDILSRVFDSKIMREFEAAKNSVMLSLEEFKAAIQVVVANAGLEGQYISSVGAYNEAVVRKYTGEIGGETAAINAAVEFNKAKSSQYIAEIQGATAELNGIIEKNKGLSAQFSSEVQGATAQTIGLSESNKSKAQVYTAQVHGAVAPITAVAESNRSVASAYSAAISSAGEDVKAQGERERAAATAGDINSRKALSLADIASKFALSNIDAATRKYLGDVQVMQGTAQAAAQLIASALNSVNVSASIGFSGGASTSISEDKNTTETDNIRKSQSITA